MGGTQKQNQCKDLKQCLFKHKYITAPTVTPADAIVHAAKELEDVIKNTTTSSQTWAGSRNAPTFLAHISQQRKRRAVQILRGWALRKVPHLRGRKGKTSPAHKHDSEQINKQHVYWPPSTVDKNGAQSVGE